MLPVDCFACTDVASDVLQVLVRCCLAVTILELISQPSRGAFSYFYYRIILLIYFGYPFSMAKYLQVHFEVGASVQNNWSFQTINSS